MASRNILFLTTAILLLALTLAAPAEKPEELEKQDLVADEKEDLKTAASHWGGHYGGWGGHYGGGWGGWGGYYPYYGSYWGGGWPSYGFGHGGYGYWPYGGYYGGHGYWW